MNDDTAVDVNTTEPQDDGLEFINPLSVGRDHVTIHSVRDNIVSEATSRSYIADILFFLL